MGFNENLRKIRKARGMTQKQLAEKLGVRRQTVVDWEKPKDNLKDTGPDFVNLKALVTILEVPWNKLMDGEVEQVKSDFPQWKNMKGLVVALRTFAKGSGALYEQAIINQSRKEESKDD